MLAIRPARAALLVGVLLAAPLAAQARPAAADLLAREGIFVEPPPGFPAFERSEASPRPGFRWYRSRRGTRMILVGVVDPRGSWGGDDMGFRREHFQVAIEAFTGPALEPPVVTRQEDPVYLSATARVRMEQARARAAVRVYVPRTGAPRAVGIQVMDLFGLSDPADDPAVMAFLDAARPRVDDGRSADPLTFRQAGVEIALPAGIVLPTEVRRDMPPEARGFYSRSGDRHVMVLVVENGERGSSAWPAERRMRHMEEVLRRLLPGVAGEARLPAFQAAGLGARDFPFTRIPPFGAVTGRGRMYTTQSGPHRMVVLLYYETDTGHVADEQAVLAMFDSLRVRPGPGR
jgi:hypothetical protein